MADVNDLLSEIQAARPQWAQAMRRILVDAARRKHSLKRGGDLARYVVMSNAGCLLQIAREARLAGESLRIVHPMELLDASYRRAKL